MTTEPEKLDKKPEESEAETEDDVEGHLLGLTHPVAWELDKARQQQAARESARHRLLAEAKDKARRKR